jgi:EAL and modified HD-GYP domain-containing signal transduction protein
LNFKAGGYRFSLDQYNFEPESTPLLEVVDYVKVNVLNEEGENTRAKLAKVSGYPVVWVAERVETEQQYLKFHQLGFSLFQGYFLAKPLPVEGHSLKRKAISAAETLNAVSREGVDIDELAEIVTRNPYLAAQLLKIINSPVCVLQRKISSLKEAIVYLGLNAVRNWAIMLTMLNESSVSEGTERLVLTRAKACEEYATTSVFADPEKAFLVGLLSGVSLLFGIDNKLFLKHVSLNEEIISAVLLRKGFLGQILDEIIKTEHAIMQNPGGLKSRDDTFIGSFYVATNWVEQTLNTMGTDK